MSGIQHDINTNALASTNYSAIGRHIEDHGLSKSALEDKQFSVLKKCRSKFDYLIFETLLIKELKLVLTLKKSLFAPKRGLFSAAVTD